MIYKYKNLKSIDSTVSQILITLDKVEQFDQVISMFRTLNPERTILYEDNELDSEEVKQRMKESKEYMEYRRTLEGYDPENRDMLLFWTDESNIIYVSYTGDGEIEEQDEDTVIPFNDWEVLYNLSSDLGGSPETSLLIELK